MRTHVRHSAPRAVLLLTAAVSAVEMLLMAPAADARRAPAPPTPENLAALRACESGGDYARASRRYYGAYQFSPTTWRSLGYDGMPHVASPEVQDEAALRLQERSGWRQWPACSRRLGLR